MICCSPQCPAEESTHPRVRGRRPPPPPTIIWPLAHQQMYIIMDINFYCLIIFSCSTKCETSGCTATIISGAQTRTAVPEQWLPASSCYNMVARWPEVRHHHGNGMYRSHFSVLPTPSLPPRHSLVAHEDARERDSFICLTCKPHPTPP